MTQKFLKALSERNLNAIVNLFAENVDWYIPGNQLLAPWLGKRSTKEEVRAFYELLWASTVPISAEIDSILTDGGATIIAGNFTSKMLKTGKICQSLFFIHLTVQDNLIVRYRLLEDTYEVVKSLIR